MFKAMGAYPTLYGVRERRSGGMESKLVSGSDVKAVEIVRLVFCTARHIFEQQRIIIWQHYKYRYFDSLARKNVRCASVCFMHDCGPQCRHCTLYPPSRKPRFFMSRTGSAIS